MFHFHCQPVKIGAAFRQTCLVLKYDGRGLRFKKPEAAGREQILMKDSIFDRLLGAAVEIGDHTFGAFDLLTRAPGASFDSALRRAHCPAKIRHLSAQKLTSYESKTTTAVAANSYQRGMPSTRPYNRISDPPHQRRSHDVRLPQTPPTSREQ